MNIVKKLLLVILSVAIYCSSSFSYAVSKPNDKPIIAQFFGIWTADSAQQEWLENNTPFNKLNRAYLAFAKIVKVGDHYTIDFDVPPKKDPNNLNEDRYQYPKRIIDKIRAATNGQAEIFISLAGDSPLFVAAAADPKFADNVVQFLQTYGLQGLDVDWELDSDYWNDKYKAPLSKLMTNLYTTLNPLGYKLTFDLMPNGMLSYDYQVLASKVDQFNLMSYGYLTDDAGLKILVDMFNKKGILSEKIIAGVETEVGYNESGSNGPDTLGPNGTIAKKTKYSLQNLAGIMEWRLDNDYVCPNTNHPTFLGAQTIWQVMNNLPLTDIPRFEDACKNVPP